MQTKVLRINYNHCKEPLAIDYMTFLRATQRCVMATLLCIDTIKQKLTGLVFEDSELQGLWVNTPRGGTHEQMVVGLGIHAYRHHLEDLHEQLELFLERNFPRDGRHVFVSIHFDAACFLCLQFRYF